MTTNDPPVNHDIGVALRRAIPIKTSPKLPPAPATDPIEAARAIARAATVAPKPPSPAQRPGIETKIAAAGYDAEAILRTLDTEMALRRAGRSIKGNDQIQTMRVLSVAMLFTLLIAALGAMSYVQTQFIGHGFKHRPAPVVTASPAPDPSVPAVPPARQSAPRTH